MIIGSVMSAAVAMNVKETAGDELENVKEEGENTTPLSFKGVSVKD